MSDGEGQAVAGARRRDQVSCWDARKQPGGGPAAGVLNGDPRSQTGLDAGERRGGERGDDVGRSEPRGDRNGGCISPDQRHRPDVGWVMGRRFDRFWVNTADRSAAERAKAACAGVSTGVPGAPVEVRPTRPKSNIRVSICSTSPSTSASTVDTGTNPLGTP